MFLGLFWQCLHVEGVEKIASLKSRGGSRTQLRGRADSPPARKKDPRVLPPKKYEHFTFEKITFLHNCDPQNY